MRNNWGNEILHETLLRCIVSENNESFIFFIILFENYLLLYIVTFDDYYHDTLHLLALFKFVTLGSMFQTLKNYLYQEHGHVIIFQRFIVNLKQNIIYRWKEIYGTPIFKSIWNIYSTTFKEYILIEFIDF